MTIEADELAAELASVRQMLAEALDGTAQVMARERELRRGLEDIRRADAAPAAQLRTIAARTLASVETEQAAHWRPAHPRDAL